MIKVVPFQAAHLAAIRLQDMQAHLSDWVTTEQGLALEAHQSYTALLEDEPVAAAGVIEQWRGRSIAWAFISDTGPRLFLPVHRAIKHFLDGCYVQRVEMTVDCDFPAGHRWAKMLGFEMEAERMRNYSPDGRDCALYARILA